jgi:chaperone required for assembly of F1-ATPase
MTHDDDANGKKKSGPQIKDSLRAPLPKRFYKAAEVGARDGGFAILLDGRGVKTPGKRDLIAPTRDMADAIAAEWNAQGERIDPASMPLTRLVNTAIDAVSQRKAEVAEDIVAFAGSDLTCYRAEAPATLVQRQAEAWDPVLAWARQDLGAGFRVRTGMMPIEQTPEALEAVRAALSGLDALTLAALHVLTTITGSALLALAHLRGRLTADQAWAAATVDETWQIEQWGRDAEADALAALKRAEFSAASLCLRQGSLR